MLTQSKQQRDPKTGKEPEGILNPKKYIQLMRRSKLAYSFLGTGYRSHREWEALLCGALLLNDKRSVDCCQFKGLVPGKHFITIDEDDVDAQAKYWLSHSDEREAVAKQGFDAAWEIWKDAIDQWHPIRKTISERITGNGWP